MRCTSCRTASLAIAAALLAISAPAQAQVTWNGGGANTTWSTPDNWSTTLSNGFNSALVFQGSSGLTNSNNLTSGTATSITFNAGAGAFSIGGNTLALTGSIANNSSNLQSIANNITLLANSTVTGTNVTLSGTLTNSGGNRSLTNGLGTGKLLTLGAINLSEGNTGRLFTLSGTGNTTINGAIADGGAGPGSFTVGGSGTVTFAGNSTYSGTTTVNNAAMTVVIGGNNAFGSSVVNFNNNNANGGAAASTDVTLSNRINIATTFNFSGTNNIELAGPTFMTAGSSLTGLSGGKQLTLSGTFFLQDAASGARNTTLGGNILISGDIKDSANGQGSSGIVFGSAGTLTFTGSNSYSGGTSITSNQVYTLVLGHKSALGTGGLNYNTGNLTIRAVADLGTANALTNEIALASSNALTVTGSNSIGFGNLTNSGANRTVTNNLDAGKTLSFSGTTFLQESGTGVGRTLTIGGSGNTTLSGKVVNGGTAGSSSLTISNTGTTTLGGDNSYSGGTTLSGAGTVVLGQNSSLGSGAVTVSGAGTIRATADLSAVPNAFTVSNNATFAGASSIAISGTLTQSGGARIVTNNIAAGKALTLGAVNLSANATGYTLTVAGSGDTIISGVISNGTAAGVAAGGLTVTNTGLTTLSGSNSYTGKTTVNGGTLGFAKAASLYNGNTASWTQANINVKAGSTLALNVGGSGEFDTTAVTTLLTNLASSTNAATGMNAGSTIAFNTANADGGVFTIGNVIANTTGGSGGARGLTKLGGNALALTAANTYSGTTTILDGRLQVDPTSSLANTARVVINGSGAELRWNSSSTLTAPITFTRGTLSGTGTIGTAVALDSLTDTLSPGSSPGIMPFNTSQTWGSFTYEWETNNFLGTTAGDDFDQISIAGSLDLTGGSGAYLLDLVSLTGGNAVGNVGNFSDVNRSWTILTTTGGITGFNAANWTISPTNFTSSPAATGSWTLEKVSNDLVLSYVIVVPEPATLVLAGTGIGLAGWSLRRRRAIVRPAR